MILVRIGKRDEHITNEELAEILSREGKLEWHELLSDPRADEDFERIYRQDLLRKIFERVKLSRREKEALTLFLEEENFSTVAKKARCTRWNFWRSFYNAVKKLRKAAAELGEFTPNSKSVKG